MVQYYISLVNINYMYREDSVINPRNTKGLTLNVTEKVGETLVPVDFLMDINFKLFLNNVELEIGNQWQLDGKDSKGNYQIRFTPEMQFKKGDYLIATVNRPGIISNKLFIDFDLLTNRSGEYIIENYKITAPGTYYFVLDSVDGTKINKKSEYSYIFV